MSNMVGNENGIALWNLMASTEDELEKEYFDRLNSAASKYGTVWYSDSVTQRETKSNQTLYQITWNGQQSRWEVIKFHTPEGAREVTDRISNFKFGGDVIELSVDDIITDEE